MLRNSKVKITCFYCNQASFIHHRGPGPIRVFDCPQCTATNRFNERGEIIDYVPPSTGAAPIRYAYPRDSPRARSIKLDGPVVCQGCQNNHSIIVQQLAEYLPDESDPNYEYKAEHIDDYRRELEERYPPLCDACAPKVDGVIRKLNYKAKSQGLARLLENSRISGKSQPQGSGISQEILGFLMAFIWHIWRLAYWSSVGLFLFWQLTTLMAINPLESLREPGKVGWEQCFRSPLEAGYVANACNTVASRWYGRFFPWILVLFFYDYKWMEVRRRPGSYVEGRAPYILCQFVLAGLVSFNWWFLSEGGSVQKPEKVLVFTAACLMVELLVLFQAFTTLKVARPRAQFSLKESRPLVPSSLPSLPGSQQGNSIGENSRNAGMRFRPTGPSFESVVQSSQSSTANDVFSSQPKRPQSATPLSSQSASQPSFSSNLMPAFSSGTSLGGMSSQASDPDAMDWNPNENNVLFNSQSFTAPRPLSRDNDSDDEDINHESPVKNFNMRPKRLMIDGEFAQQTGLESLFTVAAKLDDAKPTNQPGITSKRWRRIGLETGKFFVVCAGSCLLLTFEGPIAFGGLAVAFLFGTCRRLRNLVVGTESRIQTSWDVLKRYGAYFWCVMETCGVLIVAAETLGFHILPIPPPPIVPPLGAEEVVAETFGPHPLEGRMTAPLQAPPSNGKSQLLELIIRLLFVSIASNSGWAFGVAIFFKGTKVPEKSEAQTKRMDSDDWNSRDVSVFTTVNHATFPKARTPSPHGGYRNPQLAVAPTSSFNGANTGGFGVGPFSAGKAGPLSSRSNFSSWAPKNTPNTGFRNPANHSFGSTTAQNVKLPPPGMPTARPRWNNAAPNFASSSFQQPRSGNDWES